MEWIFLLIAGIFEIVWSTFLKLSDGFTKLNYTIFTILGMIISFYFLAQSIKGLPMGIAYTVWTGIGAIGAIMVSVFIFKDKITAAQFFFITLLLIGIIGLKFFSKH
jgi:quaternary ammonium compound-resistance protein SugE